MIVPGARSRRPLAAALAAVLVLGTPGLPAYQAFAQVTGSKKAQALSGQPKPGGGVFSSKDDLIALQLKGAAQRGDSLVYVACGPDGALLAVSAKAPTGGAALELTPDGNGGLKEARHPDGSLSDYNGRRKPSFSAAPDGFNAALANVQAALLRAQAGPAADKNAAARAWNQLLAFKLQAPAVVAPTATAAPPVQALAKPLPKAAEPKAVVPSPTTTASDAAYADDKLAEGHDLSNPNDESSRLLELRKMLEQYQTDLVDRSNGSPAAGDEVSLKEASDKALQSQLDHYNDKTGEDGKPRVPVDEKTLQRITEKVTQIEQARAEVTADLAERDALRELLAVAASARKSALNDRRSGKEMLTFHENLARLDSVMQIALALNEINAAQKAITDMMGLIDQKIAKINGAAQQNAANTAAAQQNQAQIQNWKDQANATIKSDQDQQKTLVDDEAKAGSAVTRIGGFQTNMTALISLVNARDRYKSPDALTEYKRRLQLLPLVVQWRTTGKPGDTTGFSMQQFVNYDNQVGDYLKKAQDGLSQLSSVPVEFAGAVVLLVPGPAVNISNPSKAQVLQILSDRKKYWTDQKTTFKGPLDSINRMMDPSNGNTTSDEFGNVNPESLPKRRAQNADTINKMQSAVQTWLAQIDAAATQINSVAGSNLPPLSGQSLTQLEDSLSAYGDKLRAVHVPDAESSDAGHEAAMNEILIAQLLPYAADAVIQWAQADATVKQIDDAMSNTLPVAQQKLQKVVDMLDAVLADVDADVAYVNNGGDNQALLNRKTALLQNTVIPALQGAKDLIENTLIPYQKSSIASADPNTGDLQKLFNSQITLMNTITQLYGQDVAWAVGTFGGAKTDAAGSHASVASFRKHLTDNLNGYDDATGHHEGILEYQTEVQHRKDPNYGGTEQLYGETQPYSLPKKISQYTAERAQRAAQVNDQDAQINQILDKITSLSKTLPNGGYDMSSFKLPIGVTADANGAAKLQAVVDAKTLNNLSDKLTQIGNEQNNGSASIDLQGGSSTLVPSGTQPSPTLPLNLQVAMLALSVAQRLVPSSLSNPQSAPATYAIARFLYSDSVIKAAQDALTNQIPPAEKFLGDAVAALNAAVASTQKSDSYVDSNGTSETADALYTRMVNTFAGLDSFLKEGIAFFNLKVSWDQSSLSSIDNVGTYYNSLNTIYTGGTTANQSELNAATQIKQQLQKTFDDLQAKRVKFTTWMSQLNDPHESALKRVNESISDLQDKTRAVLEANLKWHDLDDQMKKTNDIIKARLAMVDEKQQALAKELQDDQDAIRDGLPVDLVNRIESLRLSNGSFAMGAAAQPSALVIKKSQYSAFVDTVLHALQTQTASMDMTTVRQDLLNNPSSLSQLIPGSQMVDFGNDADGFYLVYQSKFSVPYGLQTESQVTLGNVAKLWGNNVSVTGYMFSSPPNDVNAPFGDKGVDVNIESLQGRSWVNYLDVDFHRFGFDAPPTDSAADSAKLSRLMLFDDFAVLMFGDRLYIGLAGFGDFAVVDPQNHPYYYGGNLKTSLKLTEVMKLNAEQQELYARDPRSFFERVNLDFTGYDPTLNQNFDIRANGDNKEYHRTQIGPSFDIARLMAGAANSGVEQDAFVMDLFWAKTSGTDDINQQSLGASILKGFSLRDASGKPWAVITNKATGELGQQYNTFTDRLSITFPNQGIVISGQGKILGNAQAYYGEIAKKLGDNTQVSVGYGSPFVGLNDRLSIMMNTSFTLGDIWQAVVDNGRKNLQGGEQLQKFNKQLDDFFKGDNDGTPSVQVDELHRVFEQDVARKIITQDIGTLRKEIDELRKAGAILDNTRTTGFVGFVSSPVSNDSAELATGGGFVAGSMTQLTLTKTQKALIDAKAQTLYREGLRLQERLLDLSKQWQGAVAEIAQAQWDLKLAAFMVQNAGSDALRQQALLKQAEAQARLNQAVLRYNMLSGRQPGDPVPFDNLNAADLEVLMKQIKKTIATPDRLYDILHSLDKDEMSKALGDNPFNIADWLPIIDRLTIGIGTQFQDALSNQVFTAGVTLRLPIYDPSSKAADKSYRFEAQAEIQEMEQAYQDRSLRAQKEKEQAELTKRNADVARPGLKQAAQDLSLAIRAYRNGLIPLSQLQTSFDSWRWYAGDVLDADVQSALAEVWAAEDKKFVAPQAPDNDTVRIGDLTDAFTLVSERSATLKEVALRQQAAAEMAQANDHRIQKAFLDVSIGAGLTASGIGWLPSIGITGIPVTPMLGFEFKPEELRELEVKQGKGQTEYYARLKQKLEAGLALEMYQNVVAYKSAQGALDLFDNSLIPQLQAEVTAKRNAGATDTEVMAAQRKLDDAQSRREQAELARRQSKATMNYLLGRPPDASLKIDLDPDKAQASLQKLLAAYQPVANEQGLLAARVDVARAVETMVDKDLKREQLALEPVSLVVRSLGRLIDALGSDTIGNPELTAAARIQTLTEERAQESFLPKVKVAKARAYAQLSIIKKQLVELAKQSDPESQLKYRTLWYQKMQLEGILLSLGADPNADPAGQDGYAAAPSSFADLQDRLARAEQDMSTDAPDGPVDLMPVDPLTHQAAGFARYYFAHQTLGHEPIDKNYVESWIEVKLKLYETDPQTLLKLADLRRQKADKIYKLQMSAAHASGDIMAADFQTQVQMLRWAQRMEAQRAKEKPNDPNDPTLKSLVQFEKQLSGAIESRADEMKALLNLKPGVGTDQLIALVPEEAGTPNDLDAVSRAFIDKVRALQIEQIKQTLFDGGLPGGLGNDEEIIHQLRADTIAERMSYKGFTPVAAFGIFRGKAISGLFLEAPDPTAIQKGLENILADTIRKQLQASGELQELTLALHSLMLRVQDGAQKVERCRELVEAAESDYRAQIGRPQTPAQVVEVEASRRRLVDAWMQFSKQLVTTKSDFIALVAELEALGQGRETGLMPLSAGTRLELPSLRADPTEQLMSYWTRRMLDESFRKDFFARLDALGDKVPPALRAAIDKAADYYAIADRDGAVVEERDFSANDRLDLLTRNDKEGKRQALAAELGRLFDGLGGLRDPNNPLLSLLRDDLTAEAGRDGAERQRYLDMARSVREGEWKALPAPAEVRAAHDRVEGLREDMEAKRQLLLENYLAQVDAKKGPTGFIMTNQLLDGYLKAQQAYDDELIKTFQLKAVNADRGLAWRLDGLFDLKATLNRQMDRARSGRGLLALDALIMLEESRLQALRWDARAPQEIDRSADALQRLRERRESWTKGAHDLQPVYGVAKFTKDGAKVSAVESWMTADQFDREVKAGTIKKDGDGRYYKGEGDAKQELLGGIDAAERAYDQALGKQAADERAMAVIDLMKTHDAVLDKPLANGNQTFTVDELFSNTEKKPGLLAQGRLFFFERPKEKEPAGRLHNAIHPLVALSKSPLDYVMFYYDGPLALARDRYPTLESLANSPEAADFHEITLSAQGAQHLAQRALDQRAAQQREGWVDVKLNSYGFARDEKGQLVQLYITEDDFNAQVKGFKNAVSDLADAKRELEKANEKKDAAQKKKDETAEAARQASVHFQEVQLDARKRLTDQYTAKNPKKDGESDVKYGQRVKAEVDKLYFKDDAYNKAKDIFDPIAKDASKAADEFKAADAQAFNAANAVKGAEEVLAHSKTWSLYLSKDVTLGVDRQGGIVSVAGTPVYSGAQAAGPLQETIAGGPQAFTIRGEMIAAALDKKGRFVTYYQDPKQVAADAPSWTMKTVEMGDDDKGEPASSTEVKPRYRLAHYEMTTKNPGTGETVTAPVMLSRRYMVERADAAKKGLDRAGNYGILPWNWGDLILELPRGVIQAPIELITGRDPKQQHYLGRVYMYKTEGGTTEHHGFFRKVLGVIDVLDILPDPVERFYDPSQFPDRVKIDSPVLPGQSVFQKDPTTLDGEKDVKYGVGSMQNFRRESLEDLTAARERTLAQFHGGVQTTLVETLRGRGHATPDGWSSTEYVQSQVIGASGQESIEKALKDPIVSSDPRSDGASTVVASADPGNIAIDRVVKRVKVTSGADQLAQQADALKSYPAALSKLIDQRAADKVSAEKAAADAQSAFDGAARRRAADHSAAGDPTPVPTAPLEGASKPGKGGAGKGSGSPSGGPLGQNEPIPGHKPIDDDWWQRFLAGFGLLAVIGGAAYIASESKQDPPPVDARPTTTG